MFRWMGDCIADGGKVSLNVRQVGRCQYADLDMIWGEGNDPTE